MYGIQHFAFGIFSNHKPASNDDVFLNRITVMLSNRTDVEKEKIYRLIKTALSLESYDNKL